jgi:hypothetical protein
MTMLCKIYIFQMIHKMINYQQMYDRARREEGDTPCDYYDPNIMQAEQHYKIEPQETVLIVINGIGYRYSDDTIHELKIKQTYVNDDNDDDEGGVNSDDNRDKYDIEYTMDRPTCEEIPRRKPKRKIMLHKSVPVLGESNQLCVLTKNCSSTYTIFIGAKTPLQWLLDMPRVTSKLCYCSLVDLTSFRINLYYSVPPDEHDNNDDNVPMFTAAADETIVIKY